MKPVRSPRRRGSYTPGPDCAVCGLKRINVRHNVDLSTWLEGEDYYKPMQQAGELHEFRLR